MSVRIVSNSNYSVFIDSTTMRPVDAPVMYGDADRAQRFLYWFTAEMGGDLRRFSFRLIDAQLDRFEAAEVKNDRAAARCDAIRRETGRRCILPAGHSNWHRAPASLGIPGETWREVEA